MKISDNNFTLDKKMMLFNKKIAILISIIELLLFVVFIFYKFVNLTIFQYICFFIIIPTVFNFGSLILGNFILNKKLYNVTYSIYVPIIISLIFIFLINILHFNLFLELAFILPIYQTTIFGEKSVSKNITITSIILTVTSFLFQFLINLETLHFNSFFHLIIVNILLVIAYNSVKFLIDYESSVEDTLYESLSKQISLKRQLEKDQLSGLYNHSYLFNKLNNCIKENKGMCLAVIDIDFFKRVNDTYGHESGNVVIRKLGEIMFSYNEDNIIPARYGGEEFAIIFINKSEKEALHIMEKIKKEFTAISFKELNNGNVTFSCGIAGYEKNLSSEDFFTKADEIMYYAKENGRNQIVLKSQINH